MSKMQISENSQVVKVRPFSLSFAKNSSKTQQQFKKDADINTIMGRYRVTGILGDPFQNNGKRMFFGDFTNIPNYTEVKNQIDDVNQRFMSLSAEVRAKFGNDPQNVIDYLLNLNEENREEAEKLGLITPQVEDQPLGNLTKNTTEEVKTV